MGTSHQIIQKNIPKLSKYPNSKNIFIKRNFKTETINVTNFISKYLFKLYYMDKLNSKPYSSILNKLITSTNY